MRSFAEPSSVVVALLCAVLLTVTARITAQESPAADLFTDAQALEATLRKDIGSYRAGAPSMPIIRRARILVGTYEDIARLFSDSGYGDRSLWQGTSLAADVFDVFKDAVDRASAVRLAETLESKYPSSPLLREAQRRVSTLALAPPGAATVTRPAEEPPATAPVAAPAPPVPAAPARAAAVRPATAAAQTTSTPTLRAIRREVLADVLRISLELDHEVVFRDERLTGPARVFVDLPNTRAATDVQDAALVFTDDVVRQIRVGRQIDRRLRVVLDLTEAPKHSVYTLYNPFRIVIDFERQVPAPQAATPAKPATPPPAASVQTTSVQASSVPAAVAKSAPTKSPVVPAASPATRRSPAATPAEARPAAAPAAAPTTPSAVATAVAAVVPPVEPPVASPRRDQVFPAPSPATIPGGRLSMSRQLGLGVSRVVIDPGHGGQDPGAKQDTLVEAELVLDVALRLEQLLLKDGIEVILTRRSNVYVALEERPAIAAREAADLYLSIHANASSDRRVRGVETYVLNFARNAQSAAVAARENTGSSRTMTSLPDIVKTIALNNKIDESRDLARQVQAALVDKLSKVNASVRNLGVKEAPFAVLVGAEMPSILAEIGFITNKQDAALVKTAVYRQKIAEALAAGITRYQQRLKPAQVAAGSAQ